MPEPCFLLYIHNQDLNFNKTISGPVLEIENKVTSLILNISKEHRNRLYRLKIKSKADLTRLTIAAILIYFSKISTLKGFVIEVKDTENVLFSIAAFLDIQAEDLILTDLLNALISLQKVDSLPQNSLISRLSVNEIPSQEDAEPILISYKQIKLNHSIENKTEASFPILGEVQIPLQLCWLEDCDQESLQVQVRFNEGYHSPDYIKVLTSRILFIMDQFSEVLNSKIDSVNILLPEEQALLTTFNATDAAYPKDKSIVDLFEAQAVKSPDAVALVFEDNQLTYKELNERSNQLAGYLQKKGVIPEMLMPICIERGLEMIIGILGILKAGGAYVPIDPEYPVDRIRYILEDTGASVVLSSRASRDKLNTLLPVIELDGDLDVLGKEPSKDLSVKPSPNDLAYVIYTSGSTGRPKGVMVEHLSVVNLITAMAGELNFKASSSILSNTTYSFDIFYLELYMALMHGARLVILSKENSRDGYLLQESLERYRPTHMQATPSAWQILVDAGWMNREQIIMLTGGEPIKESLKNYLTATGPLFNVYGPTETTIYSTFKQLSSTEQVSIGKPLANTRIYIVSAGGQLNPMGVTGEICIGGAGLARGYLNRAELTREHFIKNPFVEGERIYRTGDLGRWLPDGNVEYLGRNDDQVKIRGYRIELGEIEGELDQSGLVSQGVVLAKDDSMGNKQLVGYVVPESTFNKQAIRDYLNTRLPDYMVPALWVELEQLPLTANGKLDKKALPDPVLADMSSVYTAPRNQTEQALSVIWQELLGVERVGVCDNFFELGGHSLLAMRMVSSLRRALNVELSIKDLFLHPTIAGLSEHLEHALPELLHTRIEPAVRPEHIPLSFSQERLWFIDQLEGSIQYHVPFVLRLKGVVDQEALEHTLRAIIERHEVLRTVILEEQGQGYQQIMPSGGWMLGISREGEHKEGGPGLAAYLSALTGRPFDLSADYMLRADLIRLSEQEHMLAITMHHIASDGWSISIFIREVVALYNWYTDKVETVLPALAVQYADYAIWQRNNIQGKLLEETLAYWTTKLEGVLPLQLPADFSRPTVLGSTGAVRSFSLGKDLTTGLQFLSHKQGTTLYMTLLAAFKVLLYRYSGQEDICVGTPTAGRELQEVEGLIGFFINTLALRSSITGRMAFIKFLEEVKETALEAYEHQQVPFEKVVNAVVKTRDRSISPLFQVLFVLQNTPEVPELRLGELHIAEEVQEQTTAKFELSFILSETPAGLQGIVEYSTDVYSVETIERMTGHYINLLQSVIASPESRVDNLNMLSTAEQETLLNEFNATDSHYLKDKGIVELFEEQAVKIPEAVALVFEDNKLTYKELNERSNQLAGYLQKKGVTPEMLVPICIERGLEMIIGILGILKAGGAYVPIDPEYPVDRIRYILEDTGASVVLSSRASRDKLNTLLPVIELDGDLDVLGKEPSKDLSVKPSPNDLAYVIYTSGSTGRPKGVLIEHRSVVSLVKEVDYVVLDRESTLLSIGSPSFDAATFEYWGMLLNGGRLILSGIDEFLNSERLKEIIDKHKVTVMFFTTSLFNMLVDVHIEAFAGLQNILTGGERISEFHIEKLRNKYPNAKLINCYGPTENTTFSTTYEINSTGNPIPIGRSLSNRTAYILNEFNQQIPIGEPGEIYLGGPGVARGYLNNDVLTAEKFIKDPFSTEPDAKMYRSGDIGRYLPDGNIDYLGRIDGQVKIRGYRIEPEEVEMIMLGYPEVKQVVVLALDPKIQTGERTEGKYLAGYYVSDHCLDEKAFIAYLVLKLPEFLVPGVLVHLSEFPLTLNGKIDRKALPDPDFRSGLAVFQAPRTELQAQLCLVFAEVLGLPVEMVGISDDFFRLGGSSILAVRLVSRLNRSLLPGLNLLLLFRHRTIQALLDSLPEADLVPDVIGHSPVSGDKHPLSFAQERLWFIHKFEADTPAYNIPLFFKLNVAVDLDLLEQSIIAIVNRHEVLRSLILLDEHGTGYQKISSLSDYTLEIEQRKAADLSKVHLWMKSDSNHLFDLEREYPLRVAVYELPEGSRYLSFVIHHIAFDGWSMDILTNELGKHYHYYTSLRKGIDSQLLLNELSIQYKDYACWQRSTLSGERLKDELNYWREKLLGYQVLNLPSGKIRPLVMDYKGNNRLFCLDQNSSAQLRLLARELKVSLYSVLLSGYYLMLRAFSGQDDLVIGTPASNRNYGQTEGLIGFFVNSLVLRKRVNSHTDLLNFIRETGEEVMQAQLHQELPFEKLVQELQVSTDLSRNPIFQVMFGTQNFGSVHTAETAAILRSYEPVGTDHHQVARFDLTVMVEDSRECLNGVFNYLTSVFEHEMIEAMMRTYVLIIKQLGALCGTEATCSLQIDELNYVDDNTSQVLSEWNQTSHPFLQEMTIQGMFESQVVRSPLQPALIFGDKILSYSELNVRSNRLAHYLRQEHSIGPDSFVALCLDRSQEMLVSILGVLKAGGAYVPVDPEYPLDRIGFIFSDTAASVVLTNEKYGDMLRSLTSSGSVVSVDSARHCEVMLNYPTENPTEINSASDLAYLIYTSGTTGHPKGVMIEHRGIINRIMWMNSVYPLVAEDRILQKTPYTFDVSVWELFWANWVGAAIVFAEPDGHKDPSYLIELMVSKQISIVHFVPSMLGVFQDYLADYAAVHADSVLLPKLRNIFCSGEKLSLSLVQKTHILLPDSALHNLYGPTEASVDVLFFACTERTLSHVLIGRPIWNTQVYILDRDKHLLPIGAAGELYIGGIGLSRGYLNRAELTGERFIANPFVKGERIYKTGDLVRWLPDGNIEYLGRNDDQVKIRGYRIELGEIESLLDQSGLVSQGAVLAADDTMGNKQLVGYVVPRGAFNKQAIQNYLKTKLPAYMVPAVWVVLEQLPVTANGKLDKKALSDPVLTGITAAFTAPRSEREQVLVSIWQKLLGVEHVGINDNFFEIGGHSLLAMRMVSAIRRVMNIELSIKDLFLYATIAGLSEHLEHAIPTLLQPEIVQEVRQERIPLSFSQERLWFIHQLEGSIQYHMPLVLRLRGSVACEALEHSLRAVIDRHEVLRTVILEEQGQGYQQIMPARDWKLSFSTATEDKGLSGFLSKVTGQPFDLSRDYMLRAELIRVSDQEHVLTVTMHHIASDGWSVSILIKELIAFYKFYTKDVKTDLPALPVQYADYAIWQRSAMQGELLEEKLCYWTTKLEGVLPLALPTDQVRPAIQRSVGALYSFNIDKDLTVWLQSLSHSRGVTLYMTLLATFNVLLYRYSGQEDICIGTPTAGRTQQEVEGLIGFFINTLALRSSVTGNAAFNEFLEQVKETALEAYAHQEVPFEKVVNAVVKTRDRSRHPLFQILFVLQNTPEVPELKLDGLHLSEEIPEHTTSQFDISFLLYEHTTGLTGTVEYNTDLYSRSTMKRMAEHYINLLRSVITSPESRVDNLNMLSKSEEQTLLATFNATDAAYPKDKSIVDLFEEQVARSPDAVALVFEDNQLTYKELHERSNQLAGYLQKQGVTPEMLVPICIERGLEMIIGILAILKAGGAYVPVDPEYPADRICYILEDIAASMVLGSEESRGKLPEFPGVRFVDIDQDWQLVAKEASVNIDVNGLPGQLAYILYTSGSTGKPKGVMMPASSLINLLYWQESQFTNKIRRVLQFATFTFDVSFQEIFSTLCFGSTLYLINEDQRKDMYELLKKIEHDRITHLFIPFIVLQHLAEFSDLNLYTSFFPEEIIVAGEQLKITEHIKSFLERSGTSLINQYGPTEAHVVSSYLVDISTTSLLPPIGKPIANTQIYLLNNGKALSPVGVMGEICIGGVCLAQGYLNNAELTAEKFIKNPFSKELDAKLYRTGDHGRWLADGNIEYIGRIDDQVKIRGYRIELSEIESVLNGSGLVNQGIVLAKQDDQGHKRLVGYVVASGVFDKQATQDYLNTRLPAYMVPAIWVVLERLPVTPNGKIDKKALPDPVMVEMSSVYTAPRNKRERTLATIWQELLGVERVGIEDNFFELGGHSLLAMRMVSVIRRKLSTELSIRNLFAYPCIAELSEHLLNQNRGSVLPSILAGVHPEHIPLSFSQERLWFIDQLEGSIQYHMPIVLRLTGSVACEALEHSLRAVIDRHEVLRTVILEEQGQGYQQIMTSGGWVLSRSTVSDPNGLADYLSELTGRPFDLSSDYMLRAELIRLAGQEHILAITMHHIASDGWSIPILIREISEFYKFYTEDVKTDLPALAVQYADYAIWQRSQKQGKLLEEKLGYWTTKLEGVLPLQLPADFNRPTVLGSTGAVRSFSLGKDLTTGLQFLSHKQGTTLYMTLLAAFKVLLYRYSGQEDICVGTPAAGREQQEVEGLIGFFINTLALRSRVTGSMAFNEFLEQVKETALEAYEHQQVPFEKVVNAVVKTRDRSISPLFQVLFVLQNTPDVPELRLGELHIAEEVQEQTTAKFELSFILSETPAGLQGIVEYSTDVYSVEAIERMTGHYINLLKSIVASPAVKVGELEMLDGAEKETVRTTFNATEAAYPKDKSIVELFEEQAARSPDAVALVFEDNQLTYKELNERSNQLAGYLQKQGVTPEMLVPICIERGLEMIIGILGILKAGGAYVPIDPEYPVDRIRYILEDTGASVVLSSRAMSGKLDTLLPVIQLDGDLKSIRQESRGNLSVKPSPNDLAYVIYTSGSTGRPKGVLIEHQSVVSLVKEVDYVDLNSKEVLLVTGSPSFDATTFEYWGMLLNGGRLILCGKEDELLNSKLLKATIRKNKISMMWFTSSLFNQLTDMDSDVFKGLETVLVGGEKLSETHIKKFRVLFPETKLINGYGPTENTTFSLTYKIHEVRSPIPIGRPLTNRKAYILNQYNQLSPVGVLGEICVGGPGIARGYLNNVELTAEKFIKDPFSIDAGARLYRTGDLGRWLSDGSIEYSGRIDDQVKIRGYRIELGEIESILNQSGLVCQGVVLARVDSTGNKRLVGYVIPLPTNENQAIQDYLKTKLPAYMVPAIWVVLKQFPKTVSGKIDRKALPDPVMADMTVAYTAPGNETERALAAIWQELLGVERVGIHNNFFELGGHSLLAMRVVSAISRILNLEISIMHLFKNPTIAGMIRQSDVKGDSSSMLIPIRDTGTKMPLYIICGIGGTAYKFIEFVQMLDPEQPVYALQQPLDATCIHEYPSTIEGIADLYIEEILKQNSEGPYALSGHCVGGIVAHEMAIKLQERDKKVALLGMFDSYSKEDEKTGQSKSDFHPFRTVSRCILTILLKLRFELYLVVKHPKQAFFYKLNKVKLLIGIDKSMPETSEMELLNETSQRYATALSKYTMKKYDGPGLVFYAKEKYSFTDKHNQIKYKLITISDEEKNTWGKYIKTTSIYHIDGAHSTIFDAEYGEEFGTILQEHLNRAGGSEGVNIR